jgi:3'(2'), 5'-bisphosphate nucleotidase
MIVSMISTDYSQFLEPCKEIAKKAGDLILQHKDPAKTVIRYKVPPDKSPETIADNEANQLIVDELQKKFPLIPVIAEENAKNAEPGHKRFFMVDPMDGTTSFVNGEREYTVNIALIDNGRPVMGVIWSPPQKDGSPQRLYWSSEGAGAYRQIGDEPETAIKVRDNANDGIVVLGGRSSHTEQAQQFTRLLKIKGIKPSASSIKFCQIAEGSGDFYPRFGNTMEWDIAAGHAILNGAGGHVIGMDGKEMTYGKPGYKNPHFIAYGPDYRKAPRISSGMGSPG